jgi:hypothetical protein
MIENKKFPATLEASSWEKPQQRIRPESALINNRGACFDQGAFCAFTGTLT